MRSAVSPSGSAGGFSLTLAWIDQGRAQSRVWRGPVAMPSDDGFLLEVLLAEPTLLQALPEAIRELVAAGRIACSVHGRRRGAGDRIKNGDRLELLPPLQVDPKLARQRRVDTRRRSKGRDRWNTGQATPSDRSDT